MSTYLVANWKSHATLQSAAEWLREFYHYYTFPNGDTRVIIAPPFVFLHELGEAIRKHTPRVALAVQDLSPFPPGNYTGAVAADMVKEVVEYAIIGHSSRRRYFHETNQEIANKVSEAVAAGITPILCLDRPYAHAQMAALGEDCLDRLVIAYDPAEPLGVSLSHPPEEAARAIQDLGALAPDRPLLYGGPISAETAAGFMRAPGISGLLVGSASLDPVEFANICAAAAPLPVS